MNSIPNLSDIILQIIVSFLTLVTSLITAYFVFRLGQQKKTKVDTELEIIRVATTDIQAYSKRIVSKGERKDLLEYLIYTTPIKVKELENTSDAIYNKKNVVVIVIFNLMNFGVLILQINLLYYVSSVSSSELAILSGAIIIVSILTLVIIIPFLNKLWALRKKYKLFHDNLEKVMWNKTIESLNQSELSEFIQQRRKMGFGTSIQNIRNELELYGIKIADSEIIRGSLNISYSNSEERRQILDIFYMDGKTHENFDEISDEEILNFADTIIKNMDALKAQENG